MGRRREETQLAPQMSIQHGPRFGLFKSLSSLLSSSFQVFFLSIISLFFWLPLAVQVMIIVLISFLEQDWPCDIFDGLLISFWIADLWIFLIYIFPIFQVLLYAVIARCISIAIISMMSDSGQDDDDNKESSYLW